MREHPRDSGTTLIELLVVIVVMGAVMAFAVGGWSAWTKARAQSETATQLRAVLRSAQQRAITEGRSMCVSFSDTSYTVWRGSCTSGDRVSGPMTVEGAARLASPAFTAPTTAVTGTTATFTPRGTASSGAVTIVRPGSSTTYQVKIQGITGRAYLCHDGSCDAS